MLRRISTAVGSAAVLGLCVLPAATANASAHHAASGSFTIPSASSAVKAWGSWSKYNGSIDKVEVCVRKVRSTSDDVAAEAQGYNSSGKTSELAEIGAVYLQGAASVQACGTRYIHTSYLTHLKVYSFLGSLGKVVKKSSVKTIW
jgi:hypothetical protein